MASPEDRRRDSPFNFETAVANALQPGVRRLLIIYLVGVAFTVVTDANRLANED